MFEGIRPFGKSLHSRGAQTEWSFKVLTGTLKWPSGSEVPGEVQGALPALLQHCLYPGVQHSQLGRAASRRLRALLGMS